MLEFSIEILLLRKEPISQVTKNITSSLLVVNLNPQIPYAISIHYFERGHLTDRRN
jgi:hypothetical protein